MNEQTNGKEKQLDITKFASRLQEVARNAENKNVHDNEIAEKLGMDGNTFSKKKNGRQNWNITDLMNIAAAYHCSIDYLLGLSDVQPKKANAAPTVRDMCIVFSLLYGQTATDFSVNYPALKQSEIDAIFDSTGDIPEFYDAAPLTGRTVPEYTIQLSNPSYVSDYLTESDNYCAPDLAIYQINKFLRNYLAIAKSDLPNAVKKDCVDKLLSAVSNNPIGWEKGKMHPLKHHSEIPIDYAFVMNKK